MDSHRKIWQTPSPIAPTHPSSNGEPQPLEVIRVDGRYPYQPDSPSVFNAKNIHSTVTPYDDGTATIRIDDAEHDDMWIEITVRGSVADLLHQHSPALPNEDTEPTT